MRFLEGAGRHGAERREPFVGGTGDHERARLVAIDAEHDMGRGEIDRVDPEPLAAGVEGHGVCREGGEAPAGDDGGARRVNRC